MAPAGPGAVAGSLTVVGELLPDGDPAAAQVYLFRTPDAPRAAALRRGPLRGGPRVFRFALDAVPPGTYYFDACLAFRAGAGCTPYTNDGRGTPAPIDVRAGETVDLTLAF